MRPLIVPDGSEKRDLENTQLIYEDLKALTPIQATDERLWAYLAHGPYWEYMTRRWGLDDREREFTREGLDISWFDEGKETLTRRVRQIQTGIHWAEEPVSRISHLLSNIQLIEVNPSAAEPAEVSVRCRFLVYRNRVETETDILVGKREDLLRRVGSDWRIARRKILLDQNVLLSKNLTFFF